MRRFAVKTDDNAQALDNVWVKLACPIQRLDSVGGGCPDRLIGCNGRLYWVEYKNPKQSPSKRELRDTQVRWRLHWHGYPVFTVETAEDVQRLWGQWREAA